jgi:hypothetical protein
MDSVVLIKNYESPPISEKEILRYSGCKANDSEISNLMKSCIAEVMPNLSYKACYCCLPLRIEDETCDFGAFSVKSKSLALNLKGCNKVLLFSATIGVGIDRLISKYSRISPAKALMMQAIGAERIEALCDTFCEDIAKEMNVVLKPRFSPGYGDTPLNLQKDIFKILNCSKHIGLSLNNSMLMSPSKSVTAFAGIV